MDNNNNWEYDYSHLYNNGRPQQPVAQQPTDGVYHYAYAQPQTPVQNAPVKKKGRHVGLRILAGIMCLVLVAGVGFGGGYLGSVAAMKNQPASNTVVMQSAGPVETTSTGGSVASGMSVSDVAEKAGPSVVSITVSILQASNGFFGGTTTAEGAGSGVVVSEDGYVLTNQHVVDSASDIRVTLQDGTEYPATVVGQDAVMDVAVVKINANGLTPVTIGDSSVLRVGDTTVAIGNPLGTLSGTVTSGIISALDREVSVEGHEMSLIQTSASVNPGSSGGGLFNDRGQLVGLVNAGATSAEGVGFAIPINDVMTVASDLIENGTVTTRPVMGVTVITISDAQSAAQAGVADYGVYIQSVTDGGAAAEAGLQPGDLIVSMDGQTVSSTEDLTAILADHAPGDTLEMQVARNRQIVSVTLTLKASGTV